MSDENSTQFQFRLGGIELEISGDQAFVEKMYSRVMRDIETARKHVMGAPAPSVAKSDPRAAAEGKILWVHRCSPMMHKIYMSSPAELAKSPIFRLIDASNVSIVFADRSVFDRLLPSVEKGATLWAELTERGRQRIAQTKQE